MTLVEEMQGKPRPTPGILKTIESVMSIVRQSREEDMGAHQGQTGSSPVEMNELLDLFKSDLSGAGPRSRAPRVADHGVERQDAEDLARIRAALYNS